MAKVKKQKKGVKRKGGIMGRSDIPFAQRVAMQQRNDIIVNRDHAAKITMFCMSVAMNELEGIGYKRLVKFSLHFKEVVDEFYEDVDLGMAHAKRRMEQMGMPISGEFYAVEVPGLTKRDQQIHDHALQAVQIALICGAIIPEGRQICPSCERERTLLGYGKKSRLLQVMLVVEHAVKRRWKWIFGKGGKK